MVSVWHQLMTIMTLMVLTSAQEVWEQKWNTYLCTFYLKSGMGEGTINPSPYQGYLEVTRKPTQFLNFAAPCLKRLENTSFFSASVPPTLSDATENKGDLERAWRGERQSSGHSQENSSCWSEKMSHHCCLPVVERKMEWCEKFTLLQSELQVACWVANPRKKAKGHMCLVCYQKAI